MRWLHIYLSMLGLAVVLFFSVTGITLNHPDWFYAARQRRRNAEGTVDLKWLKGDAGASADGAVDPSSQVAKLEIVERLRKDHKISGRSPNFESTMLNASSRSKAQATPPTRSSTARPVITL